jgi:ribosomal protein S18 acetylase RimI-like enzyme
VSATAAAASVRLVEEPAARLAEYAAVPVAFEVNGRVDTTTLALAWRREPQTAHVKDYDAIPGNRPTDWPSRWDLDRWRFIAAYVDDARGASRRVGGAAVVVDPSQVEPSAAEAGDDIAVLWDIRVHPDVRRSGVGERLLAFAEHLARAARRRRMMAETQDINVAACRFYQHAGYKLVGVDRFAYPDLPDEARLTWAKRLNVMAPSGAAH